MQTSLEISWTGIPSAADDLFYPSISFVAGEAGFFVALLLSGNLPSSESGQSVLIQFHSVEMVSGYNEFTYWGSATTTNRPRNAINRINNSTILGDIRTHTSRQDLEHLLICGNSCCELIYLPDFDINIFPEEYAALDSVANYYLQNASPRRSSSLRR
ncbi:hypothetical protein [Phenylobacterium sp.]|uniref:hypothetical protein n=1 Tax=Phenylobacterium sp. TaxID=1871053 RepID=UPI002731ACB8|nr:hypothetical protein [Phenylobacterium sp.]MDP2214727.1 hypothetical protein [Phenylobacterium sp.]